MADPEETLDVFGGIASLVDESLLCQQEGTAGEPRFRMLETVREYGLERLEASGEGEATRDRLAAWSLALAEQAEPAQYGGNISPAWIVRLDQELPNLRAAVTWLLQRQEATRALRLLATAEDFWSQQHLRYADLHRWLETALAAAPAAPARDRALAHWQLSTGSSLLGHDEAALHHAQRTLEAAEKMDDPTGLAFAHLAFAFAWEDRSDFARSAAAYTEAIPLLRAACSDENAWFAQAALADKRILQGNLAAGVPMLDDALARLRQSDPPWFMVLIINLRGHTALLQGDLRLAVRLFAEAIDVGRGLHNTPALLNTIAGLAGVGLAGGQAERAARLLGAVEAVRASMGITRIYNWPHVERIAADTRAALDAAAFAQTWSAGQMLTLEEAIAEALAVADEVAPSAAG